MTQQDASAQLPGRDRPAQDWAAYRREMRDKALHEEAERLAVPTYDWVAQPISGLVDALISASHHKHHPHGHHGHTPDEPPPQ